MIVLPVDDDVELRLLEPHHARMLLTLLQTNRAFLAPWFEWVEDLITTKETTLYIEDALEDYRTSRYFAQFGIFFRGELVGCIGSTRLKTSTGKPELSFWLNQAHTGRGIIIRSARIYLRYMFGLLQVPHLEVHCAVDNHRSQKIAETLGFTRQSVGDFADVVVYQMTQAEWQRRYAEEQAFPK